MSKITRARFLNSQQFTSMKYNFYKRHSIVIVCPTCQIKPSFECYVDRNWITRNNYRKHTNSKQR